MRIELRECSVNDGYEILEMLREIGRGENGFENSVYNIRDEEFRGVIHSWIDASRGIGLRPDHVPQTVYWLYADDRPVGIAKLRSYLNDRLRSHGGHIGYCIRPSERKKGYGTIILGEVLKKASEMKIPRALITCNDDNTASRRVIEKNGGILEKVTGGTCLYWIRLDGEKGMREIHPDDYYEMIRLWMDTPGIGISEADSESRIRDFLLRNPGFNWCFKDEDRIVATSLCGHDGRRGYIYHTAVLPQYRGRGIGRMLVEKNLLKLKEAGIEKCHIFAFADNELGNAFWNAIGWEKRNDICVCSRSI